jgi:BspA type Leucine rich repeat region (6 copies)
MESYLTRTRFTLIQYPNGKVGNYALPNSVTNIEAGAFEDCVSLTSITIPGGVASLAPMTFSGCVSLTNFALGANITSIGNEAFSGSGLTSIMIPSTVTNIGSGAFGGCANLTAITVDTNNLVYSSVEGVLFDKNQITLIQYPNGKVGNFTIPNTITSVGLQFEGLYNLTGITIPDSVTNISTYAFYQCYGLTNVTIGNNVTSLGEATFSECSSLVWVTLGKSIAYIGVAAFEFNGSPLGVFFQGGPPQFDLPAFYGDGSVTFYYLPGAVGWSPQVLGSSDYDGFPVVPWNPQAQTSDGSFGVQNNQFGFTITGTTNIPIVVEGCTNLVNASWTALQSCTLTNGSIYFSDAQWANYPARFYRLSPP